MLPFSPYAYGNEAAMTVAGASYVGPGDIVGSAVGWWGLRAYSNASIGTNAIRLIRASDSTQQDFVTLAGGGLDITSINTFLNATTGKIVTLYDQSGNAHNLTNSNPSARPEWSTTAFGTGPSYSAKFVAANSDQISTTLAAAVSQTFTVSCVVNSLSTTAQDIFTDSATADGGLFISAGKIYMYAGTNSNTSTATFTNNTSYAIQYRFSGATSQININGSNFSTTPNPGTNSIGTTFQVGTGFSAFYNGFLGEIGIWASDTTSSSIGSNQKSYWGF